MHTNQFDAQRRRQGHRAGNQNYMSPASRGGIGDGVAHLSAGTIGDEAHRVKRLLGWSGRDQDMFAFEVALGSRYAVHCFGDAVGIRQASGADGAAGEPSFVGVDENVTARAQRCDVFLRGDVVPHLRVHGRR